MGRIRDIGIRSVQFLVIEVCTRQHSIRQNYILIDQCRFCSAVLLPNFGSLLSHGNFKVNILTGLGFHSFCVCTVVGLLTASRQNALDGFVDGCQLLRFEGSNSRIMIAITILREIGSAVTAQGNCLAEHNLHLLDAVVSFQQRPAEAVAVFPCAIVFRGRNGGCVWIVKGPGIRTGTVRVAVGQGIVLVVCIAKTHKGQCSILIRRSEEHQIEMASNRFINQHTRAIDFDELTCIDRIVNRT